MDMKTWAKVELDIALPADHKDVEEMQNLMKTQIIEMVELFSAHGHTQDSSRFAISVLTKLLTHRPLTPITGAEDEWGPLDEDLSQQNKRCSGIFRKDEDNSQAYFIDGKVFSDDGGHSWFTNGESAIDITFPYEVPVDRQRVYLNGRGEKSHQILTRRSAIKELWEKNHPSYTV